MFTEYRAKEEIDRVLGKRSEVTYQDVNELKYCSAIFKEALRLFPPIPNINRRTNEELTINGYKIPNYTFLVVRQYFFILFLILWPIKYNNKIIFLRYFLILDGNICKRSSGEVFQECL